MYKDLSIGLTLSRIKPDLGEHLLRQEDLLVSRGFSTIAALKMGLALLGKIAAAAVIASLPINQTVVTTVTVISTTATVISNIRGRGGKQGGTRENKTSSENEGSLHSKGLSIEWANLNCELEVKDEASRNILTNAVGKASPGRMLAIMGPSGSGKTTLLTALSSQMPKSDQITLKGNVLIDGQPQSSSDFNKGLAFVPQEDVFYSQLTVIEILRMAASFQLPESMTAEQKEERVQQVVKTLGLTKCSETIVGDKKTRGISGGEKKRLSIGLELLSDPAVIIADEPTTGLDSFQAEKVMRVLQGLAKEKGITVICTIHQPKSSIFALFDDVVLLSEGCTVFGGSVTDAEAHFAKAGLTCPSNVNLAEHLLDIVSVNYDSEETEAKSHQQISNLVQAYSTTASDLTADIVAKKKSTSGHKQREREAMRNCNWWKQVKLLYFRSFRQVFRDKATNMIRITTNINSALVFGSIYWRLKRTQVPFKNIFQKSH